MVVASAKSQRMSNIVMARLVKFLVSSLLGVSGVRGQLLVERVAILDTATCSTTKALNAPMLKKISPARYRRAAR
jgi:hypothetical protein